MGRRVILPGVLGVHLAVALIHGSIHATIPVVLAPWLNVLVLGTVFVGPVTGLVLARRGHPIGLPLFTVAMAGSVLLGASLHFLVENPDNVRAIPHGAWHLPFGASAAGVTLSSALGTVTGAWYWRTR